MKILLYQVTILLLTLGTVFADEARDHFDDGLKAGYQGNYAEAMMQFNTAIALNTNLAEAYMDRAVVEKSMGDLDASLADLNEAIKLKPYSAFAYNVRGNLKAIKNDLDGAIADYTQATKLDPASFKSFGLLATVEENKGDLSSAFTYANKGIDINPVSPELFATRSEIRLLRGDVKGALKDSNRALQLKPEWSEAYIARGNAERQKGDLSSAVADYNKSFKTNPDLSDGYIFLGILACKQGDLHAAVTNFNQLVVHRPNWIVGYLNRGIARGAQGDLTNALADFNKLIELRPDLSEGYGFRGMVEENEGDLDKAFSDLNQAIVLKPSRVKEYYRFSFDRDGFRLTHKKIGVALPMFYIYRGLTKELYEDSNGAISDLNQAIKLINDTGTAVVVPNFFEVASAVPPLHAGRSQETQYSFAYRKMGNLQYDLHDFTNALADYRLAAAPLTIDSVLEDYVYFRIWLSLARLGKEPAATVELKSYWENRNNGTTNVWPSNICLFLAGQTTEPEFLQSATNTDSKRDKEQHCEAYFYAGSKRLLAGDASTAADYFRKCVETNVKNFEEYRSAKAELKYLQSSK